MAAAGNYRASPGGFVGVRGDNGEITHARRFKQQNCDYSLIEHLEALCFPRRDLSAGTRCGIHKQKGRAETPAPNPRASVAKWGLIGPLIDWLIAQNHWLQPR